ncbi:MAG: adenosylcobinamide-phosphate synthase CbiB [Steroidobacteraceae bacterium]
MTVFEIIAAVLLDGLLGELHQWHPLVGFGGLAQRLEEWLNPDTLRGPGTNAAARGYFGGVIAVLMAVMPPALALWALDRYSHIAPLLAIGILYFVIGHRSLHEHALAVERALRSGRLEEARRRVGAIVSRDTHDMDASRVAAATIESLLENGNDALFGALFWFVLAGAPGALAYRLVNTLDAMWGYRTSRYREFGWAAARLDDVLNLIPARLTALGYAVVGHARAALRCWWLQAPSWDSPNAGPVMAAGAGALGVRLGGGAFYHGNWRERSALGEGRAASIDDIERARRLILRTLLLWVTAITLGAWLHGWIDA